MVLFLWGLSVMSWDGFWFLSMEEVCGMVTSHAKSRLLSPKEIEMVINHVKSQYLSPKEMEMVISHVKSQHLSPKFLRIVIDLHSNSLNPGAYVLTFNQLM